MLSVIFCSKTVDKALAVPPESIEPAICCGGLPSETTGADTTLVSLMGVMEETCKDPLVSEFLFASTGETTKTKTKE